MHRDSRKLSETETARLIGRSQRTLARWRVRGEGPAFYELPGRVIYDAADVEDWLAARRRPRAREIAGSEAHGG